MAVTKENILDTIASMSVMEVVELIEAMEKRFNVSAASFAMAAMPTAGGAAAAVEEKTEFSVVLSGFGDNKVNVIKVIRTVTGLGLKEAKDLVESAPVTVKEGLPKKEADAIKQQLEEAGASVEIK